MSAQACPNCGAAMSSEFETVPPDAAVCSRCGLIRVPSVTGPADMYPPPGRTFHDLPADAYPITVTAYPEGSTDDVDVVWSIVIDGPGVLPVPPSLPGKRVRAVIRFADGDEVRS